MNTNLIIKISLGLILALNYIIAYSTGVQGLTYSTYAAGGASPSRVNRTLLTTGTVSNIDFSWGSGQVLNSGRSDGVIVNFTGYYKVPGVGTQTYYFGIDSDDGQILTVNNTTLVNCWCEQGSGFRSGSITLQGGSIVPIDVWYYENGGGAFVKVYWYNPNGYWEIVPSSNFATDSSYFDPTVTIQGSSSSITQSQQITVSASQTKLTNMVQGNRIDIEEKIGSNGNSVTIEQTGNYNLVQGAEGGKAILNGSSNTINIHQGDLIGRNLIEFSITGNSNNVSLYQSRNISTGLQDGNESGGHYIGMNLTGSSNFVMIKQANDGGSGSGHFGQLGITGNSNSFNLTQNNNSYKIFFGVVDGSNNAVSLTQQGTGNHYLDLSLTGNGHTVTVNQKDSGSHRATINLQNLGGASTLNLTQQGTTGQQYNILQQCANLSGCSVSVTQGP